MKYFYSLIILMLINHFTDAQQWQIQLTVPDVEFNNINFTNANTGYAFGDSSINGTFITGVVLKTTDHGNTWNSMNFASPNYRIFASCILNGNEIYAAGRNAAGSGNSGLFIKSMDGGNTWINSSIFPERLYAVGFNTSSTGWIGGKNGFLSSTIDGGTNWSPAITLTTEDVLDIQFLNSTTGLIACGGGELFRTQDGGTTWNLVSSGSSEDLNAISIVNANIWICGGGGTIIHSTDMGITWGAQAVGTLLDLNCISFYDNSNGFVTGPLGMMSNTTSAGNSYVPFTSNCMDDITSLEMIDGASGWFCTTEGEIFTFNNVTGISNNNNENIILTISPNPASASIKILTDLLEYELSIYNIIGKRIYTKKHATNFELIDIINFNTGIYFVEARSLNHSISRRLVIE